MIKADSSFVIGFQPSKGGSESPAVVVKRVAVLLVSGGRNIIRKSAGASAEGRPILKREKLKNKGILG